MPARAPSPTEDVVDRLSTLGRQIRAQRKRLRVSATTAAQAAGLARVTLHRIERGEPSVTMGAYLNAITALGLDLAIHLLGDGAAVPTEPGEGLQEVPASIGLTEFPQLRRIAWHVRGLEALTPAEALGLYERNGRHLDLQAMEPREQGLLEALRRTLGAGTKQGV